MIASLSLLLNHIVTVAGTVKFLRRGVHLDVADDRPHRKSSGSLGRNELATTRTITAGLPQVWPVVQPDEPHHVGVLVDHVAAEPLGLAVLPHELLRGVPPPADAQAARLVRGGTTAVVAIAVV